MRIGFIGCVESSFVALKSLITKDRSNNDVVGVITKKVSSFNNDFVDLTALCLQQSIPFVYADELSPESVEQFMRDRQADVIFCVGWSHLLSNSILSMTKHGVIGFHPAKLPANRGRHPIIWAIALGLESTASTFFKMELDADSGPIVNQMDIIIEDYFDARLLYNKVLDAVSIQVPIIAEGLANQTIQFAKQDPMKSNSWRKRNKNDGIIDFRMSSVDIHNLVLALSAPYPGADVRVDGVLYKIWHSEMSKNEYPKNIEPGSILDIMKERILVKTADVSAIYLWNKKLSDFLKVGDYI